MTIGIRLFPPDLRFFLWLSLACLCLSPGSPASAQTPRNIILFIGDGMGFEHVKAARCYKGSALSFEDPSAFPYRSAITTRSANNAVTDSAAAATAIATGFKVNNDVVSVALPGDGRELETMLELFKKRGKSTGLITTTWPTHATPAAFGAHDPSRNNMGPIGLDLMTQTQPNILFGGGDNGLNPAMAAAYGYQVASDTASFGSLDPSLPKLCALFGSGYMPFEEDHLGGSYPYPHLTDMVVKALDALERDPDGFFLMVEGGKIDTAAHSNWLPETVHETLEFGRAVQAALNWMGSRTDTLFIVTSDHETGGLTVTTDNGTGKYPTVRWSSTGHTAANVPFYATGPKAGTVPTIMDNTQFLRLVTLEGTAPAPLLYRVSVQDLSSTAATIVWNTDENCDSKVEIRPLGASVWTESTDGSPITTHNFRITALTPGTTYEYRVTSANTSGSTTSEIYTFTPLPTLIAKGAVWKYTTGTDLGTGWKEPTFNDAAWSSGPAQLGYGDGDEATLIASSPVRPCYYFRHAFTVENPALYQSLSLEVLRDDGAIVYLNGQEVARYNMGEGPATYTAWASASGEFAWDTPVETANLLVAGQNVLAVEVHQANATSTDLSFDLELSGVRRIIVALDSPAADATGIQSPATLSATVTHPEEQPLTVSFYGRATTEPAFALVAENTEVASGTQTTATWSGLLPGTGYEWFVSASDGIETRTSEVRRFTTLATVPPTVSITRPTDGFSVAEAPATFPITATASDSDGTVTQVEFFVETISLGVDSSDPYEVSVTLTTGRYTLTAAATDNAGARTTSAPVNVTVGVAPTAPSGLSATVQSRTEIRLDWADTSLNESGFEIRQSLDDFSYAAISTTGPDANSARITGLQPDTTYYFIVRAFNGVGYADSVAAHTKTLINHPPTSTDDTCSTDEDLPLVVAAPGVLGNDDDDDGDPLTAALVEGPQHGTLTLDAEGSFTYTPAANFSGDDSFTYQPGDGYALGPEATVSITVLAVNDPPTAIPDTATTLQGTSVMIAVLDNDSDIEGQALAVMAVTQPANGSAVINPNRTVTYKPAAAFTGTAEFTYTVSDGSLTAEGTVTVTVGPNVLFSDGFESGGFAAGGWVTTGTVEVNNTIAYPEGTFGAQLKKTATITKQLVGVALQRVELSYWRQIAGAVSALVQISSDGLTWASVESVTGAAAWERKTFTITKAAGADLYLGFSSSGGKGGDAFMVDEVIITGIAPNDPPVTTTDVYSVDEDQTLSVSAPGVLANDTDADADPLTAILEAGPAHGTLTLNVDGSFSYTPATDFYGADAFSYAAMDGASQSEPVAVVITVHPVQDPPVANAQALAIEEDATLSIALSGSDVDGDSLSYTVVSGSGPTHGALSGTAPNLVYTPNADFSGPDSFSFTADDGHGGSASASVTITVNPVNDAPVANGQSAQTEEDVSLSLTLSGSDVDGDSLAYAVVSGPSQGTLSGTAPSLVYTPNADFNGVDSFSFSVDDGNGGSASASVNIIITAVSDPPSATPDTYTATPGSPLHVAAPGLLGNDIDADGDRLTVIMANSPSNGRLYINADGSFSYIPNSGFSGADSFSYIVSDGTPDTSWATVTILVGDQATLAMHVNSILVLSQDAGKPLKRGYAEVVIVDGRGNPVQGAVVSGNFSGTITESLSSPTDVFGKAVFQTTMAASRAPRVTFTVTDVTQSGRTYNAAANLETSDTN